MLAIELEPASDNIFIVASKDVAAALSSNGGVCGVTAYHVELH